MITQRPVSSSLLFGLFAIVFSLTVFSLTNLASAAGLTKVPNDKVCMVNDTYFARTQIPVEVKQSTYYGCCENCKKTLTQDASMRTAIDPVSKKPVDKAKAVTGAREDGSVLYFESDKTFQKFQKM